jgi:hypothetical protein
VLSVVVLVLFQYVGLGAARRLGLVAKPAPFTELFFVNPGDLPSSVASDGSLGVDFAIVNHEGERFRYAWTVSVIGAHRRLRLATGVRSLPNSQEYELSVRVALPAIQGPATVEVQLAAPTEAISLHLNNA